MSINPQRLALADGYKNAVRGFINTQELFVSVIKNLSALKDPSGYLSTIIVGMKETTKQISTVLNESSNKQLVDGLLFQLNEQIAKDWLQPGGSKGKTKAYGLMKLVEDGYISDTYLNAVTSRIGNNVKKIHDSLEEGRTTKSGIKAVLSNTDWKGLAGGALSTAANLTPFGSVLNNVGGFLYRTWDNQNKASFNKSAGRFSENLGKQYKGDTYSGSTGGSFNAAGTGSVATGTTGGVNYNPAVGRFQGPGGKFVTNSAGAGSLSQDPLFNFFNRNAYFAGWTKDVLKLLKDISGSSAGGSGGGNWFDKVAEGLGIGSAVGGIRSLVKKGLGKIGSILPLLTRAVAVAGSAYVGWQAGRYLGEHVHYGKNHHSLDDHVAQAESHGMQWWDHVTGKYNFTSRDRQLLDQQRGVAGMSASQMAQLNTALRARASSIQSKSGHTEALTIAVLQQLLSEVKKGNDAKKEEPSSSTQNTNTQRPIHDDIGDTATQLLNVGAVGNPRK